MHVLHWVMGAEITAAVAAVALLGWVLRCESAWKRAESRQERPGLPPVPSPAALPARPRAAVTASQVYEITDARPSRATGRSK